MSESNVKTDYLKTFLGRKSQVDRCSEKRKMEK